MITSQNLDEDEYIQYEWVSYGKLTGLLANGVIHGASSMALIQNEILYRGDETHASID